MPWWDREDEDDKPHTTSLRMWSTSDRKPKGGNARMWRTSDRTGGNLRAWTTEKPKPIPSPRDLEEIRREWEREAESGTNLRTGGWTPGWKPAPLPGTIQEARERQLRTRFRYNLQRDTTVQWTDTPARKAARRGGKVTWSQAKSEAARLNGRKGGRRRKRPVPDPTVP